MKCRIEGPLIMILILGGCASKPQMVVDPQSIKDQAKYEIDAGECLEIARSFDLSGNTAAKAVGGAAIGGAAVAGIASAVAGAVFAPAIPFIVAGSLAGGGMWGAASTKEERRAREKILVQCLNDRGYKAYDVG
jgi:outer membrane lipoprotein SlyB